MGSEMCIRDRSMDLFDGDFVITMNFDINAGVNFPQTLNQVVGERVVVIYHDDHNRSFSSFISRRLCPF